MGTILWILTTTKDTPKTSDYVLNLAKQKSAGLIALLVLDCRLGQQIFKKLESESFFGGGQSANLAETLLQDYEERGRNKFSDIRSRAVEKNIALETSVKRGVAADECVRVIKELQPEEIVLTRMPGSRFCKFFFSEAADKIRGAAGCPVTVIDEKEEQGA
ncbi:MAG: universal stress protein [Candidatus Omnitrophica bacterium]|nr:universal stress protein [Candidatus Omnitrophota bacterium]